MPDDQPDDEPGRLLIEIATWDCFFHLGPSSDLTPPEHRFQGGLSYVQAFDIRGRIRAPAKFRSKPARVWISPFGPDLSFGPDSAVAVGQVGFENPELTSGELQVTLLAPESAFPLIATCLSSTWRYIHIWAIHADETGADIEKFSFSTGIHERLQDWAGPD